MRFWLGYKLFIRYVSFEIGRSGTVDLLLAARNVKFLKYNDNLNVYIVNIDVQLYRGGLSLTLEKCKTKSGI